MPVTLMVLVALDMVRVFANRFVVVTAFDTYTLPVTFNVVRPVVPVKVSVAAKTFVVVTAFDAYTLPVTLIVLVALDMVRVFANRFVVVTAFEAYTLPVTSMVV